MPERKHAPLSRVARGTLRDTGRHAGAAWAKHAQCRTKADLPSALMTSSRLCPGNGAALAEIR
jgi:hypothetical protein